MRKALPSLFLLLLIALVTSRAIGQSFQALPPVLTQEVALNQANECYIHFINPSGNPLLLKWRQLEISMPAGWDIDLCDYGTCYVGIPPNGTMNLVYDTIQAYLKLIVQPGAMPGAAWCWFRVQEVDHAENFTDVYFSLYTPGITATQTPETASLRVYPNPARDLLIVENPGPQAIPARLFNSTGQLAWQETLAPTDHTQIPLADWPAGLYFLQTGKQTQRVIIEK